ncbi:hypothetical protein V0R52_26850 [Pseudomonas asiatica]|uniref:hypothetical protein n=1 Tax=Pseudomonas asiatica TaxID=2219225 RepID=UPI002E7B9D92|nr:hypothetical protein [Pseudomonas asiatica]MEE1920013.1 hypothetical protein [Pseudomonas asiatica]
MFATIRNFCLGVLDSWMPLRSTRGVIRFGEFPLVVSDSLIDQLKDMKLRPEKLPVFFCS